MATFRILSANLLMDRARPESLRAAIKSVAPDVVSVQELGDRAAATIRESHTYGHLDPRDDGFGLGIAAAGPVAVTRLELDERGAWIGRFEPADWPVLHQPLEVICSHIINPLDWPPPKSRRIRHSQIAGIAAHIASSDAATVVIGDMNSSPRWPEYRMLAELGSDAAAATSTARRTWAPFSWAPRMLRIDHAFVAGIGVASTRVVRIKGTDHSALVVDLSNSA